jgi:hypothetical protein
MMTLVQAWIDSVQILKPKNLKLFMLVTANSIIQAYYLFFKYFWWLLLVCFGLLVYSFFILNFQDNASLALYGQLQGVFYILYTFLFMGACFITRPSIAKKDCAYLRGLYKRFIIYWFLWIALFTVACITRHGIPLFYITMYSPAYIFTILFFADSAGGAPRFIFSLYNAIKMILYNMPLLLGTGAFFYSATLLYSVILKYIFVWFFMEENVSIHLFVLLRLIGTGLSMLLLPIGVCTYANIYIKKLHDQFDLYNIDTLKI